MVEGILSLSFCGFEVVRTLMQGLPSHLPIPVPTTPGRAIHSSVLSLRTCSIVLAGIHCPFSESPAMLWEQPLRPPAALMTPMLSRAITICLTIDRPLFVKLLSRAISYYAPHPSDIVTLVAGIYAIHILYPVGDFLGIAIRRQSQRQSG